MLEQKDNRTKVVGLVIGAIVIFLLGIAIGGSSQKDTGNQPLTEVSKPADIKSKPKPQPIKLSGTTETATKPFKLHEGPARFEITYSGNEYFAATLLNSDGDEVDLLASQANKPYEGSSLEHIDYEDSYVINVEDEDAAPWSITINQ